MDTLDELTIELTSKLIRAESISPEDAGCQQIIAGFLEDLGFKIEHMPFEDVDNLWATRPGNDSGSPLLVFAGHTDVVPPGPISDWQSPPFEPTRKGDMLFGRGAADMKGSLAAMLTAVKRFLNESLSYNGSIGFLITSDEEADAFNGTVKVMEELNKRNEKINWCIVGEPTSDKKLGDVIRVGRRGSLNGKLIVIGHQGHVAYPTDAINPIHIALQALADFTGETWDEGNDYFPPTSMQISNIHSGTGVNNIIPGEMAIDFNFRFSTESTMESLKRRTIEILEKYNFDYKLEWSLSGNPFMTEGGTLIPAVQACISDVLGIETLPSTSGGTSDGRFIAPSGTEVVELGPCNKTIHKVNESVSVKELLQLSRVYTSILKKILV
jgi:succinyl-diaminopimelate desuccinylase